jgi:type I restriction enzyme S subunit
MEVGTSFLPKDWTLTELGSLCEIFGRIGFRGYTVNDIVGESEGAITISPSNITKGKMNFSKCTYLSWKKYEESPEIQVQVGDVLLVKTGSTVGKVATVFNLPEKATVNPQVVVLKKSKIPFGYLGYQMNFNFVQNQLSSSVVGGALPTLSQKQIAQFQIPIPPSKREQEAIADALSDIDALVDSLEKLIAKKRLLRRGAMQRLLTGKHRLPAFVKNWDGKYKKCDAISIPSDWDLKTLGDVGDVKMCRRVFNSETAVSGEIPFYKIGTFGKEPDAFISKNLYDSYRQLFAFPQRGDILISAAGTIGRTLVYDGLPAYFQDSNIVWIDNKEQLVTNNFLNHVLQIVQYNTEGGTIQRLYNSILKSATFACPRTREEQEAIAEVLNDINLEISGLVQRLCKARFIKHGMMQELLTGRIRLI